MEIPLNEAPQQISLAEAFAKKIGKLSSQSKEKQIRPPKISEKKVEKRKDKKKVNK